MLGAHFSLQSSFYWLQIQCLNTRYFRKHNKRSDASRAHLPLVHTLLCVYSTSLSCNCLCGQYGTCFWGVKESGFFQNSEIAQSTSYVSGIQISYTVASIRHGNSHLNCLTHGWQHWSSLTCTYFFFIHRLLHWYRQTYFLLNGLIYFPAENIWSREFSCIYLNASLYVCVCVCVCVWERREGLSVLVPHHARLQPCSGSNIPSAHYCPCCVLQWAHTHSLSLSLTHTHLLFFTHSCLQPTMRCARSMLPNNNVHPKHVNHPSHSMQSDSHILSCS